MWLQSDKDLVLEIVQYLSLWEVYRIARQAARYGHHSVASKLFSDLTTKVSYIPLLTLLTKLIKARDQ